MSCYTVTVVRGGGQRQPVRLDDQSIEGVFRRALTRAQELAVNGCPFGDAIAPRCIEIHDAAGNLVIRINIDESLRPDFGSTDPR